MSSIGNQLKITIFGESHGPAIGVTMDGLPGGQPLDFDAVLVQMARRAPGDGRYGTYRKEADYPEIISGVKDGVTTGFPLCAMIQNTNAHSNDYKNLRRVPRPSHADYTAFVKYHGAADMAGGGHFSGRLTAPLVFAGAVCRQMLERQGIIIGAHVRSLYNIEDDPFDPVHPDITLLNTLNKQPFAVCNDTAKQNMFDLIATCRKELDSVGGIVELAAVGLPAGLGGPLFAGLEGKLSQYLFGIPAVRGVSFGTGFAATRMHGSEHNDPFAVQNGRVVTVTNHCGGIQGGITNGMPLILQVAFKPTASISREQQSVNLDTMQPETLVIKGRHDPCIVSRAVVCVESAVAVCLTDLLLQNGLIR